MIHIKDVSFSYGGKEEKALSQVSLHINKGECVLLVGLSGCGKTTLTRLLNGVVPAFYEGKLSGEVLIEGKAVSEYKDGSLSQKVGSVFQNPRSQFFNVDTTGEIAFGCENIGISHEQILERVSKASHDLEMGGLPERDIFSLSGGEKQLVAIASVYAMNPDIYVMDEPSANLDMEVTERLKKIIALLKSQGKTIIIAEHRIAYLRDLADRVVYMKNGSIVHDYPKEDFLNLTDEERREMGLRAVFPEQLGIPCPVAPAPKNIALSSELHTFSIPCPAAPAQKEHVLREARMGINPLHENRSAEVLATQNLAVSYSKRKPLIESISTTAHAGEVIGIIGRNGQGKSTFAKCVCGLLGESAGKILVDGSVLSKKHRAGKIYLVMQEPGYQLFADSVEKELRVSFGHKKTDADEERSEQLLERLGLTGKRERHPLSLSGGEKQRLSVAAALMQDAHIFFLDEPTSGLDMENMNRVSALLKCLRAEGKTVFVITHDYEFLLNTCDRVLWLENGKIRQDTQLTEEILPALQEFFKVRKPFAGDS